MKSIRCETVGSALACSIRRSTAAALAANAARLPAASSGEQAIRRRIFRRVVTRSITAKLTQVRQGGSARRINT